KVAVEGHRGARNVAVVPREGLDQARAARSRVAFPEFQAGAELIGGEKQSAVVVGQVAKRNTGRDGAIFQAFDGQRTAQLVSPRHGDSFREPGESIPSWGGWRVGRGEAIARGGVPNGEGGYTSNRGIGQSRGANVSTFRREPRASALMLGTRSPEARGETMGKAKVTASWRPRVAASLDGPGTGRLAFRNRSSSRINLPTTRPRLSSRPASVRLGRASGGLLPCRGLWDTL